MEQFVLSQLFGGQNLIHAVFLAGMFAVVLFRRETIAIPGMFKLAYWLFAAAIVVPACITPFATAMSGSFSARMRGPMASDVGWVLNAVYTATGPVLFALSVLCAFGSMFPRKLRPASIAAPAPHPLD